MDSFHRVSSLRPTTILHLIIVGTVIWQVPDARCQDPCLSAVNIGDYRRSTNYVLSADDPLLCDANLDETVWYRFDAITGGKMPESCVTTLHCGTMLPIWMNDVHPTAANPGPKLVKVCAPYWIAGVGCCDWSATINVLWCLDHTTSQEYFVYQLKKPPFCSMAYCAGNGLACGKDCSWNGIMNACSCPSYPVMTAPVLKEPRLVSGTTLVRNAYPPGDLFYPTRFVVDCVIGYIKKTIDDGARFDVIFEADGIYITRFTANSLNPVATLDESYLIGYIGRTLTCRVSSYWFSSQAGSKYLLSQGRWFGLRPVNSAGSAITNNLVVKEGHTVSFWMVPSFPITTRPCFDAPQIPCFYVAYSFSIHVSESVLRLSDCALVITKSSLRSGEVKISPIPAIGSKPKPFIWQINFNVYNDTIMNQNLPQPLRDQLTPIFKNYQIQSINVEVIAPDPQPSCQSTGDPHILAFPDAAGNRAYYHIYSVGDFYLVRLGSRNLEIQVRQAPCNPAATVKVSCNCGIIVREGNSIFGINACNQVTPLLVNYRLDNISPAGTIQTIPTGWKMALLSGIVINVNMAAWDARFMDIYVIGLRSELTQYDGLCSVKGLQNVECTTACDRYRVTDANSFFNINSNNLPKCGTPYFVPTCECYGKNIDQSVNVTCAPPTGDALLPIDLTKVCSKRKRAAEDSPPSTVDTIDLDDLNYTPPATNSIPQAFATIRKQLIVAARVTKEDATSRCTESLKKSPVYSLCKIDITVIIDTCVLDCQLLPSFGPADSVATQLEVACIRHLEQSLDDPAAKNVAETIRILNEVKARVCPSQCSNHGRCTNGVCSCNAGYVGTDCSLPKGQVPYILRIISRVCNIRQQPCRKIYVQAIGLASPEGVTCKMRLANEIRGIPTVQYSKPPISGGVAICSLLPISGNGDRPSGRNSVTIYVSLSNDGATYSNEETFTVSDGPVTVEA